MNEINSYSNDCLYECKELMRKHVASSSLKINCDDISSALREEIDIEKFKAWFDRNINTFKTKQNIQSYFNRAFLKELEKGTFKLEVKVLSHITLIQALREKGVKILSDDTCYIDVMWTYIYRHGCPIEVIQDLNHKIVDYMKEGQVFADYLSLVRKAKALQPYAIDWDKINSLYIKEVTEWNAMLDELYMAGVDNNDR